MSRILSIILDIRTATIIDWESEQLFSQLPARIWWNWKLPEALDNERNNNNIHKAVLWPTLFKIFVNSLINIPY